MKNVLTASERRGILVVAALALLITGAGWIVSMCRHNDPEEVMPEVEVLVSGDSVQEEVSGTDSTRRKHRRRVRKDSVGAKDARQRKQYRRRNPLDESAQ